MGWNSSSEYWCQLPLKQWNVTRKLLLRGLKWDCFLLSTSLADWINTWLDDYLSQVKSHWVVYATKSTWQMSYNSQSKTWLCQTAHGHLCIYRKCAYRWTDGWGWEWVQMCHLFVFKNIPRAGRFQKGSYSVQTAMQKEWKNQWTTCQPTNWPTISGCLN